MLDVLTGLVAAGFVAAVFLAVIGVGDLLAEWRSTRAQ